MTAAPTADGNTYPLTGVGRTRFTGTLNAAGSAENQDHTASFLSDVELPAAGAVPVVRAELGPGRLGRGRAPRRSSRTPETGTATADKADVSYKRLTRTVDLTGATTGQLRFFTSYDTEPDWDYLFVEAHEVGTDTWTTLPDANGHTDTGTGDSCPEGWHDLHPFLDHYQGADCSPTGTTGGLERGDRYLGRLAGVGRRPVRVRRQAGRAVHQLRLRLGDPGSRRVPR